MLLPSLSGSVKMAVSTREKPNPAALTEMLLRDLSLKDWGGCKGLWSSAHLRWPLGYLRPALPCPWAPPSHVARSSTQHSIQSISPLLKDSHHTNVSLPPIFKETNILGTRSLFSYHPIFLLHCRVKFLQRIIDFHSHCPLSFFLEPFTGHCSPHAPETALPKGGSHRYLLVRSQSSSSPTYQQRWAT